MAEDRRWGKAGVRLTDTEIADRDRTVRQRRNRERLFAEQRDQEARRQWTAGLVIPHRITLALDARGLYGPEVDRACGVEEPTVDQWEAGTVYPTWEQLVALAELCGVTPALFMRSFGTEPFRAEATSLRFHVDVTREPEPVLKFDPVAVAATVHGHGACPTCGHAADS